MLLSITKKWLENLLNFLTEGVYVFIWWKIFVESFHLIAETFLKKKIVSVVLILEN